MHLVSLSSVPGRPAAIAGVRAFYSDKRCKCRVTVCASERHSDNCEGRKARGAHEPTRAPVRPQGGSKGRPA